MNKLFSSGHPVFLLTPLALLGLAASLVQPAVSQAGGGLTLPFAGTVTASSYALAVTNQGGGGGLYGSSGGTGITGSGGVIGIYGYSNGLSGVQGESTGGVGVYG